MTLPDRPERRALLIPLAAAVFVVDILIFYFTIGPLGDWSLEAFGDRSLGITFHYALRAVSALLGAAAMLHWKALAPAELGLAPGPFREDARWASGVIAALVGLSVLFIGLALLSCRLFAIDLDQWDFFETDRLHGGGWTGYLLTAVVAAPIVEEFVYRSLLTPALRQGYGVRGSVAAGAALFYVVHLVYGQPWWMVHYLVAGGILTWAFLKRGRLWICVLLHAGGNTLVVLDDFLRDFAPGLFKSLIGS